MIAYVGSRPTSPSCLEPGLPTQTTLQRSGRSVSSSRISSTTWPRLRWKLPRSRKPSFEESTTRQGSLFWSRSRLMTTLARFFDITRFERRPLGTGKLGTLSPPALEVVMALLDSFHFETPGCPIRRCCWVPHTPYLRVGTFSSPFSSFTLLISSFYCHPDRSGGIVATIVRATRLRRAVI